MREEKDYLQQHKEDSDDSWQSFLTGVGIGIIIVFASVGFTALLSTIFL